MGLLIEGRWHDQWYESSADGTFQREQAQRRNWVTADGQPGPSGDGGFKAEAGRYHLYVSLAARSARRWSGAAPQGRSPECCRSAR